MKDVVSYKAYIDSDAWQTKREKAFNHYGRKCTRCGSENNLHVHHNTYKNFTDEEMKDLNILCETCHNWLHEMIKNRTEERRLKKLKNKENRKKRKEKEILKRLKK